MKKFPKKVILFLAAALCSAALCMGLAACDGETEHTHTVNNWSTTREATCTSEGEQTGVCEICHESVTQAIPKLAHTYEVSKTIKAPTCTESGLDEVKCSVCGAESTQTTPPAHTWKRTGIVSQPSCEEDGIVSVTCSVCGAEDTQVWAALGHNWTVERTVQEASCEEDGSIHRRCTRCGKEEDVSVPALGHDWESGYTVDEKPTFSAAGSRSIHCTRCDGKKDVKVMPMLKMGENYAYRFSITRSNGLPLSATGITYTLKKNGEQIATGTIRNGAFTALLPLGTYTVELSNLPEGYTQAECETNFTEFNADGSLVCNIPLTGNLITEAASSDTKYSVGSVMHDFTYTDAVSGETVKLSELLKAKKCVILSFWYADCYYCGLEMPELVQVYKHYGGANGELAIVAVNASAKLNTVADSSNRVRQYARDNEITFNVVEDPKGGEELSWKFGVAGCPVDYFIDSEGVVAACVDGYVEGANEERLTRAIEQTMSISDPSAQTKSLEAVLPEKRK